MKSLAGWQSASAILIVVTTAVGLTDDAAIVRDVDTVAAVALVAAAALVIMISSRITAWQTNPR